MARLPPYLLRSLAEVFRNLAQWCEEVAISTALDTSSPVSRCKWCSRSAEVNGLCEYHQSKPVTTDRHERERPTY